MSVCPICEYRGKLGLKVLPVTDLEQRRVRAILEEAIAAGRDKDGTLLGVAEMLLRAKRVDEFGGLNDA